MDVVAQLSGSDDRGSTAGTVGPTAELVRRLEAAGASCEIRKPDGSLVRVGTSHPRFVLIFRTAAALRAADEFALARAYMSGELDFEGDAMAMLDARTHLARGLSAIEWLAFAAHFVSPPTWMNRRAITRHYTLGDDFYLTFIDRRYRFYSQCVWQSADEQLEDAAEHKLERMWTALSPATSSTLLDIGSGWGGVTQYAAPRGVEVTSLTLTEDSASYIRRLIAERAVSGDVLVEDFLHHRPAAPYDNAVIFGVIEHIPNYRAFCRQLWTALKPGGRLFLDASATQRKYVMTPFTRRFWGGTHTCLGLQDMVQELLLHGFDVVEIRRETHDYELTVKEWARRFEAAREEICDRWGEPVYRAFRIYLWGSAHGFATNRLQAYHLVAERRSDPGPRPGFRGRLGGFVASLR